MMTNKTPQPIPSKDELRIEIRAALHQDTMAYELDDETSRIMQLIDSYTERQVARGKLEVIESVKAWADGVEVTYNELLSGELKKLREVEATTKQKEGDR